MAALSPDNTPRFRVHYTSLGQGHVQEYRSHVSPAALGVIADDMWGALTTAVATTVIDQVTFAASGSNVFNAVTTGIEGNSYGAPGVGDESIGWFYSFIGRSSGGRRLRLYFFGARALATDYRFIPGESGVIDAAVVVLQTVGSDLRCIDDIVPTWKTYANAGVNRYWQKALRP
jgi:hypothetical protein